MGLRKNTYFRLPPWRGLWQVPRSTRQASVSLRGARRQSHRGRWTFPGIELSARQVTIGAEALGDHRAGGCVAGCRAQAAERGRDDPGVVHSDRWRGQGIGERPHHWLGDARRHRPDQSTGWARRGDEALIKFRSVRGDPRDVVAQGTVGRDTLHGGRRTWA